MNDAEKALLEELIDNLDPLAGKEEQEYEICEQNALQLIDEHPYLLSLHSPLDNDVTPLMASVMSPERCVSVALFERLLLPPTNVNAIKEHGLSVLHFLALYNRHEHMHTLLGANDLEVEVDKQTNDGDTPVSIAAFAGACQTLALLINNGHANVNTANAAGLSPLHVACAFGQPKGGKRETPITLLQAEQFLVCIELLLSAGALVNATDQFGSTPVHFISSVDIPAEIKLSALRLLIEYGADLKLKADNQNSAVVMAKAYEFSDFSEILQKNTIPPLMLLAARKLQASQIEEVSSIEHIALLIKKLKLGNGNRE